MNFIGELAALATSFLFAMTALIFIRAWTILEGKTGATVTALRANPARSA